MAYKRQIDRLPIVPKFANEANVTCHFCIVGCGYKAYTWPVNKQGGASPDQNKFGVDIVDHWHEAWSGYELDGLATIASSGNRIELTRQGLLQADSLLPAFFEREFQGVRYT